MHSINQKESGYPKGFRWLHAIVALLVICMLFAGFSLSGLSDGLKPTAYLLHKSTGLLILSLMLVRLMWRVRFRAPGLSPLLPKYRVFIEKLVHRSFYVFLILMPMSGWMMSVAANRAPSFYGLFTLDLPFIPKDPVLATNLFKVHATTAIILISLILLHITFNTLHVVLNKDKVINRMIP